MAKVFISFVHEDEHVARAVKNLIEKKFGGHFIKSGDVFLSSDIPYGENWFDRIKKELIECSVVVSLLSNRSVRRPWVNFEAGAAWLPIQKVVPAFFGNLTIDNLPRPYADLQAVNLKENPDGIFKGIAHIVQRDEGILSIFPPPPVYGDEGAELQEALNAFVDAD